MRCADVLATANSTFSFTAAMLAHPPRAPAPPGPPGAEQRFWRPDPLRRALQAMEEAEMTPKEKRASLRQRGVTT